MREMELDQQTIKRLFKESITEALYENKGFFEEILSEILEDLALSEAIRQGRETEMADRETVFRTLEQQD
jgi:DNA gyrase/topoisomerase IV subunit B